jgi:TetR/AcrR family transcriptional regulator, tetracycline repressor protein
LGPAEEKPRGLTRERLVEAALELMNDDGLDGLAMRGLAERLDVKAASLYWHVRDRDELLELLAESILEKVRRPSAAAGWRAAVVATCESLRRQTARQKDAGRVLLEAPDAVRRSGAFADLRAQLERAGLSHTEAAEVAFMAMTYVISGETGHEEPHMKAGAVASVAIDSGSRGVFLRAGDADMQSLIQVPHERSSASPAVVRGETVVVRRLRGVGHGVIELNPRHPWTFKVQAPTWNTVLDLGRVDVREIRVDSGAAGLQCLLPHPQGVVPIHIASGVVNVSIQRPPGAAVKVHAHTGAVKLRLDDFSTRVAVLDVHWQSESADRARDRYELEVSGGVVDLKLGTYTPRAGKIDSPPAVASGPPGKTASALEILLDGVEARVGR